MSEPIDDQVKENDVVVARFTNSHRVYQFEGVVVGKTKNYWKVKALVSPYADKGEAPGRVFHIETYVSRKWSENNRIVSIKG